MPPAAGTSGGGPYSLQHPDVLRVRLHALHAHAGHANRALSTNISFMVTVVLFLKQQEVFWYLHLLFLKTEFLLFSFEKCPALCLVRLFIHAVPSTSQ